jgi:hypothetical protein
MGVRLPDWWCYPEQCGNGHPWGPDRVVLSWQHCHCGPALAATAGQEPCAHQTVQPWAEGCRSVWLEVGRFAGRCGGSA